jgi:D-glycero-D-manno-heptose 1,7-bisphosphate phosphatase
VSARALFLDRDGVINHEVGYLHRSDDVVWMDGIFNLCRTAIELEYRLVVVTNQSGIARGFYSQADFDVLMLWMQAEFVAQRCPLSAVYLCPYHPTHGIGEYKREHEDRKPGPGMLFRAARDLQLDLSQSIMIGDRCSDITAANAAGLRQAFLVPGTEVQGCSGSYLPIETLADVQHWLIKNSQAEKS